MSSVHHRKAIGALLAFMLPGLISANEPVIDHKAVSDPDMESMIAFQSTGNDCGGTGTMRKNDIRGDTPFLDGDDELKIEVIDHPYDFSGFSDRQELVDLVVETINRMGGSGSSAEKDYQECLGKLNEQSREVAEIIQQVYFDMPESSYLDRWALVMLMSDLKGGGNADFHIKVLDSDMAQERSRDPHSFSTVGEEVMIRTTAIEGLERMGAENPDRAIEALRRFAEHDQFSIRRAATQAMIAIGGEEMREKLRRELPENHHDLLDIRRTDVREAEQAEGGLFLKERDGTDIPMPVDESTDKPER